jgi:hypothetical protein
LRVPSPRQQQFKPIASPYKSPLGTSSTSLSPAYRRTPPGSSKLLREHYFAHSRVPSPRQQQFRPIASPYKSPLGTSLSPAYRRTPPGSSKLLREHFAHLSVGSKSSSSQSSSTRRRRILDSGPVRLLEQPSPRHARSRMGYDGTKCATRSNELLQSTVSSRNHHVVATTPEDESSATDQSFGSISMGGEWESPSQMGSTPPRRRMDCMDPVAFTLLRGGEEDSAWLFEQDRSFSSSAAVVPKVSANLKDIYGEHFREMARPVPVFARRPF